MEVHNSIKKGALLAGIGIFLAACGPNDFNYGKVRGIIESTPLHLDAEYVMLTPQQVDCGVENDLWDSPSETGQRGRQLARLKPAGRDLKFADDVSIGDMARPYVQIRGDYNLAVTEISSDRDGPEPMTRVVTGKFGIAVPQKCFPDPLPLMGVKKGDFTQDVPPVLLFRYNNGWALERIVH